MIKFRVIPGDELSERHFDEWPVWSEHYDFDEIEDIVRWGLNRQEVLRLFQENKRGDEHCVYTLLESNPFPDRMRIFIKASLEAANGQRFKGYVINEDAFCLSVFHGGEEFFFSSHPMLDSINQEQEQGLLESLGAAGARLFPMKYTTEYRAASGEGISGVFRYGGCEADPDIVEELKRHGSQTT